MAVLCTPVTPVWHLMALHTPSVPSSMPSSATLGPHQPSAGGEVIPMEWEPRQLCLFLTWLQALGTEWH